MIDSPEVKLAVTPETGDAAEAVVPASELVRLCAVDPLLYCKAFFPDTFRQESPEFHKEAWTALEDRTHRFVAMKIFRGGAKTTLLRTYTSKRIAYGVSRTILFVSEAQERSKQSLQWIKKAVDHNKAWRDVFGLERGAKWTDEIIEIRHKVFGFTISVIALGITGQTRGVNIDDYRPDLIVVDDPCDEENTATAEQRGKISDLFFGALVQSLTPATECLDAKMALLQTPLNGEDLISRCQRDQSWHTLQFGILDEAGRSRWEKRFPTESVMKERLEYADRNQLSLWLREKMCEIISPETSAFKEEWLQYWDVLPEDTICYLGVDPVPPPSDREIAMDFREKDYEVLSVVGVSHQGFFLIDYAMKRGHDPEWTISQFFTLLDKHQIMKVRIDATAYQRTLKWLLEKEMTRRRRYVQMDAAPKVNKAQRIVQAFSGPASQKKFFIHRRHLDFRTQFVSYPNVAHDDLLDATAMAMEAAQRHGIAILSMQRQKLLPEIGEWRNAP